MPSLRTIAKKIDRYLATRVSQLETVRSFYNRPDRDLLYEAWRATGRYDDQRSLSRFGANVYSSAGEDGIIAEIFRRIGAKDRFFVDIGAGDGEVNPTRFLLEQGWAGIWIEGSPRQSARARDNFSRFISSGHLRILNACVSAENINALLSKENVFEKFDFLSLDVDYGTSHVWRALQYKSRVACIEYNASLPASIPVEVPYDPSHAWDETNWYGASLKALELIGINKGSNLVGCDINGVNAYFVEASELGDSFYPPYTAETHYEPPRYYPWGGTRRAWPRSANARKWITKGM